MAKLSYSKGSGGSSSADNEIHQTFQMFVDTLDKDFIEPADNALEQCHVTREGTEEQLEKKKFAWEKARIWYREYRKIKKEIALKLSETANALIKNDSNGNGNGNGNGNQASGAIIEVQNLMSLLSRDLECTRACIQETHDQVLEVKKAYGILEAAICDSENKTIINALEEKIQFNSLIEKIKKSVKDLCHESAINVQESKKAALIKAPLNIDNVLNLANLITSRVSEFYQDVDGNLTSSQEEVESKKTELDDCIKMLCQVEYECKWYQTKYDGHRYTRDFSDPETVRTKKDKMDELLIESEKNFDSVVKLIDVENE